MCQLRLEIRRCKKRNNLDNLKLLIKKRRNLNQQLIYPTKNQWKDFDSQEIKEIEKIKALESDGKHAARTLLMPRMWNRQDISFKRLQNTREKKN
jgi:hypothetical protein